MNEFVEWVGGFLSCAERAWRVGRCSGGVAKIVGGGEISLCGFGRHDFGGGGVAVEFACALDVGLYTAIIARRLVRVVLLEIGS